MVNQVCPTPGFEKIMVATDGSKFSKTAVQEAITIASACSSMLYAIHVIELTAEYEFWDVLASDKHEKEMRRYLEGIQAKAARAGVKCEIILHQGDEPYKYIVAEAAKRKVGTIVMGSHGRTGLLRLMMGSVTTRVIGHAPCKVLVVPPKTKS